MQNLWDFLFPEVFNFPVDGTGAVGYNITVCFFAEVNEWKRLS